MSDDIVSWKYQELPVLNVTRVNCRHIQNNVELNVKGVCLPTNKSFLIKSAVKCGNATMLVCKSQTTTDIGRTVVVYTIVNECLP